MMEKIGSMGFAAVVGVAMAPWASADVFNMPAGLTSLETVRVGNPENAPDVWGAGFGAVDYVYNIGKYPVTAAQYTVFLNAVAATDPYGLYLPGTWTDEYGAKIERHGTSGSYTYSVAADFANRPVNYVTWGSAARFTNWLHNGQPVGLQGPETTETGAYTLNGAVTTAELMAVSREPDWKWAITSENEWYKAAYHKNDGVTGNYWLYPTGTDSVPSNQLVDPDPGNNATFYGGGTYTIGSPYWRTEVGAHANSDSPYGTFDQGGNVWEWTEGASGQYRVVRGGSFDPDWGNDSHGRLRASVRYANDPSDAAWFLYDTGFRVSMAMIILLGDINRDGLVDDLDLATLQANLGEYVTGDRWAQGDFTDNGRVDLYDAYLLFQNYQSADPVAQTAVPEPAAFMIVMFGATALMGRRRRIEGSVV